MDKFVSVKDPCPEPREEYYISIILLFLINIRMFRNSYFSLTL